MFLTDAPPLQPATASPSRPAALPQTSTGAPTGALTWLPPPTLWSPFVGSRPLVAWPVLVDPLVDPFVTEAPPRQPASAFPKIAMALPQASMGALIGALTWLPPST